MLHILQHLRKEKGLKDYCEIRRNPLFRFLHMIPIFRSNQYSRIQLKAFGNYKIYLKQNDKRTNNKTDT